jgi:FtsH-binding integral membrane protein
MIELILGIIVLIVMGALAFIVVAAGAMSDSQDATRIVTPYLWTIFGIGGAAEVVLFFIWFGKHKGWS